MGFAANVGKYQLGRTIGEGTFAKVKVAVNMVTGQHVAIKIIDKQMVVDNKLMDQVDFDQVFILFFIRFFAIYDGQCN